MRAVHAVLLVGLAAARRCKLSDVQRGDGSYVVDGCEELRLFGESIGDEGATRLAAALGSNPPLLLVDLWHNGIGPAGARALGAALAKNNKLQRLYLNENPLGAEGVRALAEGLGADALSPHHLWLSRTGAGDDGAIGIAEALKKNRVLEALDLWECGISAAGARALATALRYNTVLRTLELRGNPMGDGGAQAFAELMPENKPLATLDLINTGVSDAGRAALRAGLAKSHANPYIVIFEDNIGPHQQRTSWEEKGLADAP
mmetsp:Transcript_19987/g.64923  ORF Transcript_19987/g.64923 Transcript_19987/m.64923 type:complete len:261 (+) Transcript_19987:20-802(+)